MVRHTAPVTKQEFELLNDCVFNSFYPSIPTPWDVDGGPRVSLKQTVIVPCKNLYKHSTLCTTSIFGFLHAFVLFVPPNLLPASVMRCDIQYFPSGSYQKLS